MILFNLCENSGFLTFLLILKYVIYIVSIIVPIIIILKAIRSFFSVVIKGDSIVDKLFPLFKSLFCGLLIFLIPSILSFLFSFISNINSDIFLCSHNIFLEKIQYYRELENQERLDAINKDKNDKKDAYNKRLEEEKKRNEEIKKRREEAANGSSNNPGTINIHIGDSRTVGMCTSVTGDGSGCQFSNSGPKYYENDIFIAQSAMGYSWFYSTAIPAVNNILNSNPDVTYNIISYMGVNFLLSDIDKYISSYNNLVANQWKEHNLIVVSVNPVDENKERVYGYSTKNSDIMTFNLKLKNGIVENIKYCDVYSKIIDNFGTSDGLHYTSSTYFDIYNRVNSCI